MDENKMIEELRNQIAVLKQKLNKQEIVNDRMLRTAMQTKVNGVIHRVERKTIASGVFAILVHVILYSFVGLDIVFCMSSILIMLFCIGGTIYFHRPLHKTDIMSADLSTVAYEMARLKRRYKNWLYYVTPAMLIPWFVWCYYEYCKLYQLNPISKEGMVILISLLVGAILGGIIGYSRHCKAVDTAEAIIRQIEE